MKRMNKFFTLVFAALAFTAFTACSDDKSGPDGEDIAPKGEAWITLDIKDTGGLGRSLHTPDQEAGTPAESNAKTITAIFFNGHNATSVVTKVETITVTDITKPTDAFLIPETSKAMLIIVNAKNLPTITARTTTFADVNAAVTATAGTVSTADEFMMSNAKGDLEPSKADGSPDNLKLHKSKADAESTPQVIRVDRVVAKVRVYVTTTSAVATVTEPEWVLNVTNRRYYPVSQRIETYMATTTPYDQYTLGSYRIDPNFNNSTCVYTIGGNASVNAEYIKNYNYFTNSDAATITWIKPINHATTPGDPQYCLENTQRKEDNVHAYTTQVLLKAKFIPNAYGLPGGATSNTKDPAGHWIGINGGYYTYATVLEWITEELTNKYNHSDPSKYPTAITTAFNNYLKYLENKSIANVAAVTLPADLSATTVTALVQLFKNQQAGVVAHKADSDGTVNYYDGGVNYYKIMIKHDDDDIPYNEFGEFGVVRNSVYDIRVNSFNNPGYPTIPEPDKDKPDESEAWLTLKIEINPWTWYEQEENL